MRKALLSVLTAIIVLGFGGYAWAQPMMGQGQVDPRGQAGPGTWSPGPWGHMGSGMGGWGPMGPGMTGSGMGGWGPMGPGMTGSGMGMMGPGMWGQMGPGMGMMGSMGRRMRAQGGLGMGIWRGMLRGSPEIMGAMSIRGEIMSLIGQQIQKYGNDFRQVAPEVQQKMRKGMIEGLGQILTKQGTALSEKAKDLGK